jgi:DNA-binding MarR family transcriptional regulator
LGLVERAERRGLLERTKNSDDARAVDVAMTPAGLKLADRVHSDVSRALAPATSRLDPNERRALVGLLEQMLRSTKD